MEARHSSPTPQPDSGNLTFPCPSPTLPQSTPRKKKKNLRRFSDEQIRLLESIFESETKLETRKKMQVATELGLEPRQVAIWFQNKRARWKSKQIEQDYRTLRANYDNLASRFESLKNEKQSLVLQLQKLSKLLGLTCNGEGSRKVLEGSSIGMRRENGSTHREPDSQQRIDNSYFTCSADDKSSRDIGQYGDEECQLIGRREGENADVSLASLEKWYSFDSGGQFDPSSTTSHWFNFWT